MPQLYLPSEDQEQQDNDTRLVLTVKTILTLLKIFLGLLAVILILDLGKASWPEWLINSERRIMGITLLILFFLFLLSPLALKVTEKPRPLSGSDVDSKWFL